ncbi:hypothetical protein XENTR_v10016864 [Xenopus tropicalis]|uniref:Laminin subunit alpha-3 n=1 Tax=Xenopus tropicalis TaxID=8364 RepID=A0A6I8SMM3_XENTR|nr:laminin subunit alpha-3 [Xenopus tropicalis]KAE8598578.1 hypothetical protein XENTR_v10016864 [Xenopus tropicalis]
MMGLWVRSPERIIGGSGACRGAAGCAQHFSWALLLLFCMTGRTSSQQSVGFSLHPASFNLAQGAKIRATATCGEEESGPSPGGGVGTVPRMDLYCKLVGGPAATPGHTIQGQFCDFCNSADPGKAHPISNAIDGTERWWQSPPLSLGLEYNKVNVTIDLGQLFHVAYVLIKFANSPRPDLWVLERSVDFGRTYSPWQYFANSKIDCINHFKKEAKQPITRDDDVICTTEYSRIVPLENGEIVVSLINGRPGAKYFMDSPVLRDFTKATNIRLRFLRTNTLLGHLISKAQRDPTVTRRYYYSIKDISIGGRCVCHGHADTCTVRNSGNQNLYECRCQHNTCGEICDRCCPGFNQKSWQPATIDSTNECEPCNCHGHASDCYYDADIDTRKGSLDIYGQYRGGGVCINCQHNTAGVNCERCAKGYYRPYGVPKEASHGCVPCSCSPDKADGCEEGSGRCYCKPNFSGNNCERCAEGFYNFPVCTRIPFYPGVTESPTEDPSAGHIKDCKCKGPGTVNGNCDMQTGQCHCRAGFQGTACDRCSAGHFHYPFCQKCNCHPTGVVPEVCDPTGKCLCHFRAEGAQCDQCRPGYHSFPKCEECNCDMFGAADPSCGFNGQCRCRTNFAGLTCSQCAPGFYNYPSCTPCQCSSQGSYQSTCDLVTGQCYCRPDATGQRCDKCTSGSHDFPRCEGFSGECDPTGTLHIQDGYCRCLPRVEGLTCNRCKPLYWNLARENPNGCADCMCEVQGTISGIGECHKTEGDCYCKPNVCSASCDTCKDGYYLLEARNYFGCKGCQCDLGGAISHLCSESSGTCSCRDNVEGMKCNQPKSNYYFPDLYQIKFEIEDGTTPLGRDVRFGYDSTEFPGFSWRGYAQMTSIQNEVKLSVNVERSNLNVFRIILRYINFELHPITGRITAYQSRSSKGTFQSKEIVFPPSQQPAFLTVPGKSFAEPFSLAPGNWNINLTVESVLLDYLVLLPSDFYEAPILQMRVTEPCTNTGHVGDNCLIYQHLTVDAFKCVLGTELKYMRREGVTQPITIRQAKHGLPTMADISGRQVDLYLWMNVPRVGSYVLLFEYANEDDHHHVANVRIGNNPLSEARVNLYSCNYSFLCRSIVVDNMNRIAVFELISDVEIHLSASSVHFLLHKMCIVPAEEFFIEYAEPKVRCVAVYGRNPSQSPSCVQSSFYENPPLSLLLDPVKNAKGDSGQINIIHNSVKEPGPSAHWGNGVLLKSPQNQVTLSWRIPHAGRYVFIAQYYQTLSPMFPVLVHVNGGARWSGSFNASFCPHLFGCRDLVVAGNRIALDVTNPDLAVIVEVPLEKSLILEYVLLVPADSYSHELLQEKPVDKSYDFINICGLNSFYIDPVNSPGFCKDSARSLVVFYNDGALPCNCNLEGATNPTCSPYGGQCSCRANIIGRRCSRCATGYYGFPHCRSCNCGSRLCDEVTGKCICPPQTLKPKCEICDQQSFSYHPLVGCEGCNCSTVGVVQPSLSHCDGTSGQCKCKPRIVGRQCDRCSPGHFHFPDCFPCDCNPKGTEPHICNPHTGTCLCKENVIGKKCDVCRRGSFHLDSSNPSGCTTCFCFGATDICQSSNKYRKKFVDMRSWSLETSEQARVAVTYNPGSNSVVADVQELPPSVHNLYWVAPESYLGEKISSYGGYLTYQLKSFGLPNEGMVLLDKRPDVQLTGRQMSIVYVGPNNPLPDRLYYGRVQLIERNFRHASSNNMVSREELMIILSNLESLHIRGLYFSETQRLTLGEVGLDDITTSGSGEIASQVEICSCPSEYSGDSCQNCAPGHYRDNSGLFLGKCVPCMCNGHSNRCQDGSGICINCLHDTTGDYCEFCKEGYTGNATLGNCRLCPCPLSVPSNSFATGCVGTGRNMRCMCKPGYAGVSCERCAPGYYGNPLKFGSSCQPCNCGNNGQLRSCDPLTGECFNEEPKDTDIDENDDSCDGCVSSLLVDLARMVDELNLVKLQLQNVKANTQALQQIGALEARIREVKLQHDSYISKLASQRLKVDKMGTETNTLEQEITALLEKAKMNAKKYETIALNAEETFRSGSQLLLTIDLLLKNINILIRQIASAEGGTGSGDLGKNMAEAQRMLSEMRKRNFSSQKREATIEKEEAKALLNRVKNQFQKHQDQNKNLIRDITKSINDYEAKLNDLRAVLNEANGQIKQANNINTDNAAVLQDIKNKVKDLTRQQKEATSHLNAAETSLGQTDSMLRLLQKSKEEYEKLAAQLDGAKQELSEKVNTLSKAASKEPLVIMAEKHAQSLQDLANQLTEIKRNVSSEDLVRCAMDAASAYDSIINAVKEAEVAANKAKDAADSALGKVEKEDLPGKAKQSKADSEALLAQAKNAQKSLQDLNPELEDIKDRLVEAKEKKDKLPGELASVQNSIDGIKRDDIDNLITSANELVKNANAITEDVEDELVPIKGDLEKLNLTIGTTQSADYNEKLEEASNSVKNLTGSLPDLFDAMNHINSLMPLANISESVSRIRELIQQARDAANKVVVPMRFNGTTGVEVRPPSNLEDLKAYTHLSFFLQRPASRTDRRKRQLTPDMFVMYLGRKDASKDFIGLAVKDDKLMCVYNLGGNEAEINVDPYVSQNNPDEAIMDHVVLERIYQYLSLNYTKSFTSTRPDPVAKYTTDVRRNMLLSLDPEDVVFYVGGYPSDFRPPSKMNFRNYIGCIELDSLNQNGISLYNFKRTFNLNTTLVQPCKRYKEESERSFFEGTGYASISSTLPTGRNLRYEQTIQTTTDEGVVFFAENGTSYISLIIENGILVLQYRIESGTVQKIKSTNGLVSDGNEHVVALRITPRDKTIFVLEQSSIAINASNVDAFIFSTYYLGGIPAVLREQYNIQTAPFRGCVKNVKTPLSSATFKETYGVSRRCSDDWNIVRSAEFARGGTLGLKSDGFTFPQNFQTSFGFQTSQPSATLLSYTTQFDELWISLDEGTVNVNTRTNQLQSTEKYLDGNTHYVSVIKENDELRLLVDEEQVTEIIGSPGAQGTSTGDINFGGSNFEGCISNVFIDRVSKSPTVQNLIDNTGKRQVSLGTCSVEEPPIPLILNDFRSYSLTLNEDDMNLINSMNKVLKKSQKSLRGCGAYANLTSPVGSYQFGDSPASHLVYELNKAVLKERSHFSLDVRTTESSGLIFLMTDKEETSHLSLHISKGRYVFSLSTKGNKLKIRSQDKYNDGKWHTVIFSWDGLSGRLVVDGLKARKGTLMKYFGLEKLTSVRLGGVPSLKIKSVPKKSFSGCLKNLKLNGLALEGPSHTFAVTPCYDGSFEKGIFFAPDGGHVVIDNSFNWNMDFEIALNIRPQSQSGVLFHTGSKGQQLSLYMEAGELILSADGDTGEVLVSLTPQRALCDGKWHIIKVSLKHNVVKLEVDKQLKQFVVPSSLTLNNPDAPLFLGGLPDALEVPRLPAKILFVGCMKNVKVNNKIINFSKMSTFSGAVSFSRCPAV